SVNSTLNDLISKKKKNKEVIMSVLVIEKLKEVIVINGNIEIAIAEITGSLIKLAIQAPLEIPICREEISRAILFQTN
ncbi:MAG TPA: carbon storage regulator, partial [Gammaproteobacteria bacterium]|nr:carbon storage regulator [Gammaproteobacteria bacterium]